MIDPLCDARAAAVAAIIERYPAQVGFGDETYDAGAVMGDETFAFGAGGSPEAIQPVSVLVAKESLATPPVRGDYITVDGRGYIVDAVTGHLARDSHWRIRARRAPGEEEEEES